MSSVCETSATLLRRLRDREPRAWVDFATKYTWMMRRWMRAWRIPVSDVEDILQDSCIRVFQNIHRFNHRGRGSFRAWLKQVSRSCWLQVVRKSLTRVRAEQRAVDVARFLSEETLQAIDSEIDLLIEQEIIEVALARTRGRCESVTWNSYRLTTLEGCSGESAAESLGITPAAVYKNRERFVVRLHEELRLLRQAD